MLGSMAEHLTQTRARTHTPNRYIGFCRRLMRMTEQ